MSQRFQTVRSPVLEFPDVEDQKDHGKSQAGILASMKVSQFLTIVGSLLLFLVALTPIWDSCILLNSSTYVYFVGRSECFWIISFCCGVILLYITTMLLTSRFARAETKTDQTFMYVFTSSLTLLGLGLLLFSVPVRAKSTAAYNELMGDCNLILRTDPLYYKLQETYGALLTMRLQPDCINKVSIEQCAGYQAYYPYTSFLKDMEFSYECSGFCYSGPANNTETRLDAVLLQQSKKKAKAKDAPAAMQDADDFFAATLNGAKAAVARHILPGDKVGTNLVQTAASKQYGAKRRQGLSPAGGRGVNQTAQVAAPIWVRIPEGLGDTGNDMIATGWMSKYPPNLFTDANYKTSCDGAAAREIRFGALETAMLLYLEGAALLVIAVFAGFMKLCSMCFKPQVQKKGASGLDDTLRGQQQDAESIVAAPPVQQKDVVKEVRIPPGDAEDDA